MSEKSNCANVAIKLLDCGDCSQIWMGRKDCPVAFLVAGRRAVVARLSSTEKLSWTLPFLAADVLCVGRIDESQSNGQWLHQVENMNCLKVIRLASFADIVC